MTSVRLPEELDKKLRAIAAQTKRSKSSLICDALEEHLDEIALESELIAHLANPDSDGLTTEEMLEWAENEHPNV